MAGEYPKAYRRSYSPLRRNPSLARYIEEIHLAGKQHPLLLTSPYPNASAHLERNHHETVFRTY
jgi:hypothetical protein